MREIHPSLFTQVMGFPQSVRSEMLEFLGATPLDNAQLRLIIAEVARDLDQGHRRP
ncbi:hypothetical protein Ga0609869_003477 [Rhodovulum iodosum]|uniref:Uncharacterized protein n=1 Tax=Rhodovulum iodosum TaxID=68291 RepID=A0ABV3XXT6_9RHOB|nr:hypothetical protein [Rhodovulum robiginosum]